MAAVEEQRPPAEQEAAAEDEADAEPSSAEKAQMEMRRRIFQIMSDTTLSDAEKSQRRQDLLSGKWAGDDAQKKDRDAKKGACECCVRVAGAVCVAAGVCSCAAGGRWCQGEAFQKPAARACGAALQPPCPDDSTHTLLRECPANALRAAGGAAGGADKSAAGGGAGGSKAAAAARGNTTSANDLLEDTLKCVICFNLCERPVTVRDEGLRGKALRLSRVPGAPRGARARGQPVAGPPPIKAPAPQTPPSSQHPHATPAPHAGPLPAQLLPGVLQALAGPGQEDVPHVPRSLPGQVLRQPAHQHAAHVRHSLRQAGAVVCVCVAVCVYVYVCVCLFGRGCLVLFVPSWGCWCVCVYVCVCARARLGCVCVLARAYQ
jgi:hypothetical protein